MNSRQYGLMIGLALLAGLVGGVVSSQFFVGYSAYAQQAVKKTERIPPRFKTIQAGEIQLLDTSGKTRIRLYTEAYGNPSIALMGDEGEPPRIWLRVDERNGARLFMFRKPDKKGKVDSFFYVSADRGLRLNESTLTLLQSGLFVKDRNGIDRAVLGDVSQQSVRSGVKINRPISSLALFGEDGKVIWKAP